MNWCKQWWVVSLFAALAAMVLIVLTILLNNVYGVLLLAVGVVVFLITLSLNPACRYFRMASAVAGAWLGVTAVPDVLFDATTKTGSFTLHFKSELGRGFNWSACVMICVLLVLDYLSRSPSPPARLIKLLIRGRSPETRQVAIGHRTQQVHLGDISGDQNTINITLRQEAEAQQDFNAEIDVACNLIKEKPDVARDRLEGLRRRCWDRLSPRERYRVLANIGHTYEACDDLEAAAKYFLDAKTYQPEDERARSLEALADFYIGKTENAFRRATEICTDYPLSGIANVLRIRTAPGHMTAEELEAAVPEPLRSSGEVLHALAVRAAEERTLEKAEQYARAALATDPNCLMVKDVLVLQR